jgi:hypothetical protein
MNKTGKSYLLIKFILLIIIFIPALAARSANNSCSSNTDTAGAANKSSNHSLFSGAGFGSNMIYLGSTISENQPYLYANLTYGFKNKLYASITPVHLAGLNKIAPFYIGALNYSHTFNSWFDMTLGAYRYQVPASLSDTLFSSFTYGDLTLGFDWKILYSKVTLGGLISQEDQIYLQFRNSRYFETPDFMKGKASISFDPYVNLLFGTFFEVETSGETTIIPSTPGRKWRNFTNQGTGNNLSYVQKFGFLAADFGIPVSFNTNKMVFEAEVNYMLPLSDSQENPSPKGFIFMLSAIFRIF